MNKNKQPEPKQKCFDCEHYHACSMWNIGTLQYTDATNCSIYEPSMVLVRLEFDRAKNKIKELKSKNTVEVVKCSQCRWGKPYMRMDNEIGYYCIFCGHTFKYGINEESVFHPVKEADSFCSFGERKEDE